MAYSVKLNKNVKRKLRPGILEALTPIPVDLSEKLSDIGYYRPTSSIARSGLGVRAKGRPNHHRAGSPFATGTPCRMVQNAKHKTH